MVIAEGGAPRAKQVIGFTELKEKYLPHRYPIILLDRVTDYVPGEFIEAVKCVTGNSPEMVGHFPERAIMPGTSVLQSFAQLAIVFFKLTLGPMRDDEITLISSIGGRFFAPIPPGEQLFLRMTPKRFTRGAGILNAEANINNRCVVRGSVTISKAEISRFSEIPW